MNVTHNLLELSRAARAGRFAGTAYILRENAASCFAALTAPAVEDPAFFAGQRFVGRLADARRPIG
jgi:hypothetical protein